jgi:phosphohistidine phosphatase
MKRLALIRHAKTVQGGYDHDFNRELTPRGIEDSKNIVENLKERKVMPGKIISSPAKRAFTTAQIFAQELGLSPDKIVIDRSLYFDLTTSDFLDIVHATADEVDTLFIVGHNPFMHYLAQNMCVKYDGHMPTCSTVLIDFEVDHWKEVEARQGLLFLHLYPKLNK